MRNRIGLTALTLGLAASLLGPVAAHAEETVCNGALGPVAVDNVVVPSGATCTMFGTQLNGTLKVLTNARLDAQEIRVNGNIQAEGHRDLAVRRSTVGGSVQLKVGGPSTISDTVINGDLQFEANRRTSTASGNRIGSNLQAVANRGGVVLTNNRIRQNLQCKENVPPPSGGGNTAGSKEDQCAAL